MKKQIKDTIILRPEEQNLTNNSYNNIQNKIFSADKEKVSKEKVNISIDNKNAEINLPGSSKNVNKKIKKNKFESEDKTIQNKINENSNNFPNNENKNQKKKKKCFTHWKELKKKKKQ